MFMSIAARDTRVSSTFCRQTREEHSCNRVGIRRRELFARFSILCFPAPRSPPLRRFLGRSNSTLKDLQKRTQDSFLSPLSVLSLPSSSLLCLIAFLIHPSLYRCRSVVISYKQHSARGYHCRSMVRKLTAGRWIHDLPLVLLISLVGILPSFAPSAVQELAVSPACVWRPAP